MPNPYLPLWEYIPDGEPRVFGDRVYIYGSHDRAGSDDFCDYVLKCILSSNSFADFTLNLSLSHYDGELLCITH